MGPRVRPGHYQTGVNPSVSFVELGTGSPLNRFPDPIFWARFAGQITPFSGNIAVLLYSSSASAIAHTILRVYQPLRQLGLQVSRPEFQPTGQEVLDHLSPNCTVPALFGVLEQSARPLALSTHFGAFPRFIGASWIAHQECPRASFRQYPHQDSGHPTKHLSLPRFPTHKTAYNPQTTGGKQVLAGQLVADYSQLSGVVFVWGLDNKHTCTTPRRCT